MLSGNEQGETIKKAENEQAADLRTQDNENIEVSQTYAHI